MTQRNLQIIAEQNLNISIRGKSFHFRFYPFRELMYVDISLDREGVMYGKRVMANTWILPNYVAEGVGNLRFETYEADADDYVWYEGFNTKFRLVSYTDAEIKGMEAESESDDSGEDE